MSTSLKSNKIEHVFPGKCVEEKALGHHQGALPLSHILPEGDDKDISLLLSMQPEKAR